MPETLKQYKARYYQENRDRLRTEQKAYTTEHKEDKKEYDKIYKEKNKEHYQKWAKEYWLKNKDKIKARKNTRRWQESCYKAKQRCTNPKCEDYKNYGGRGIKFLMTTKDFEYLWFRDNAEKLKQPTIDRKDNDGNYELSNCEFIERVDNIKKSNRERRNK